MHYCKLLLVAVMVALGLGSLVASASARNIFSSSLPTTSTFANVEFVGSQGTTTRCAVTLEASLHARTFAKVANALIGNVTGVSVSGCAATVLTATLPWHIRYSAFSGFLPRITAIKTVVIGFALQTAEPLFGPCLITSTSEEPFVQIYKRDVSTEVLTANEVGGIIRTRNCFEESIRFVGISNTFTGAEAGTRIVVRLL